MTFPESVLGAVSACTRTLAGTSNADAMIAQADAATLGGLRAYADRLAVRYRFHDPAIHRRHQPDDPHPAALFDAIEQGRLDALGARWMPGIAKNLLAHPGAANDGIRWLIFEACCGRPAPKGKKELAERVRTSLPSSLIEAVASLAALTKDQDGFAAAASEWARRAAAHLLPDTSVAAVENLPRSTRKVIRTLPKRGDPGATAAPLKKRGPDTSSPDASGGPGGSARVEGKDATFAYRAYTTAHDRVVNAAALVDRSELERLRTTLDAELKSVQSLVSRLAKRLMRVLMARQMREWRFDLDEGMLDGSRLAMLVASGRGRPFKEESESRFPSTVVTLLIDHSGSMRGRPMLIAAITVEIFARVLERCGVRCEVLGFTTRDWDGGEPAREWASGGYTANPGRLNALEHIIIKSADVPWRRARAALGLFLHDEMLKENIDGEAVSWAHRRLLSRPEARRILIVVSDGTPMDEATLAANGHEYLERHLQEVIDGIETRSPVQLAAIGIGHDVSAFYGNATRIARMEDLGPALTQKLISLLGEG